PVLAPATLLDALPISQGSALEQMEHGAPLALLGGDPPAAAVGAGLEHDALGLRLQEIAAERTPCEVPLQVVDLELVGVGFIFLRSEEHTSELHSRDNL